MWKTVTLLVLLGLLLVSVGGNVVQLQQSVAYRADAESLRTRLRALQEERSNLETRLNDLNTENESLKSRQAGVSAPAPRSGPDRTLLDRLENQAEQIRGLRKKQDVPLKFLGRDSLQRYFVDRFEEDYLPHERETDQKLLTTLGLIRNEDNLMRILLEILQEQVIGIYNEDEHAMYLIGDQAQFGPEDRMTFVHEFTHALQDQHYDLTRLAPKHPENGDRSLALHALIEGDAVLLQRLWAQDNLAPDELAQLGAGSTDSKLDEAPLVVRTELLFAYTDGFRFALQAFQRAGGSYAAVDDLFRNPPESTEQVLHPEKYRAREKPLDVTLPDLVARLGPAWRRIESNVLGELDLRILLEQFGDRATASRAAAGWGGDRWLLLETGGRQAVALLTRWDTDSDAREFFDVYGQGLKSRLGSSVVDVSTDSRQALTGSTMATELRRRSSDVLAVLSFDRSTAEAIAKAAGY